MNRAQKRMLLVGLVVIVALGVFPPWMEVRTGVVQGATFSLEIATGHHLLFSPPEPGPSGTAAVTYRVDYGRLAIYWAVVVAITGVLVLVMRSKEE